MEREKESDSRSSHNKVLRTWYGDVLRCTIRLPHGQRNTPPPDSSCRSSRAFRPHVLRAVGNPFTWCQLLSIVYHPDERFHAVRFIVCPTGFRIKDPIKSLDFYTRVLGMRLVNSSPAVMAATQNSAL